MTYSQNETCRICDSAKLSIVLPLKKSPIGDKYRLQKELKEPLELYDLTVYQCLECELIQIITIVDPKILYTNFLYRTNTSLGLSEHFFNLAKKIIDKFDYDSGLIVDIGSNDGSLLQGYKNLDFNVLGIEPAKKIADDATENGIPTISEFFNKKTAEKIVEEYGTAKIINCNNTMANINELNDFIEGVKILLSKEGTFIFETSYLVKLIDNMVFDSIYHEHLSYFSIKSLEILFQRHSLRLIDVELVDTKGGSIRCYVQNKTVESILPQPIELKKEEEDFFKHNPKVFFNLQNRMDKEKNNLLNYLNDNQNKLVYGYGASPTTTTLLYHFEMSEYYKGIIDDNQIKIGRYSPFANIPILESNAIYQDNPDIIVIFAWRYYEHIVSKHKNFIKKGGKFIVPLPEFKIIEL